MRRISVFLFVCTVLISSLAFKAPCQVGTWTTFTNTNFVRDILAEGDKLWIATTGGVVLFDLQKNDFVRTYTNVEGIAHIAVTSVAWDLKGDIWFGTDGGGVSKLRRFEDAWRTYAEFDGVAQKVNDLLIDGDFLWVGTDEGISFFQWGWDWDEKDTTYVWKEIYDSRNGLLNNKVTAFAADDSTIWVGVEGGVNSALKRANLKNPSNWESYTTGEGLPSVDVLSLALNDSHIWVGTAKGVAFMDGANWMEAGLSESSVYSLTFIDETLWAATSRGVFRRLGEQWIAVENEDLLSPDIRIVKGTEGGQIVCGTWGQGLSIYNGATWTHFIGEGPWRNNLEKVLVDRTGGVWCSMFEAPWAAKLSRYSSGQWTHFDEADGMETGIHILGMMEDSNGNKWFGTWGDGVSMLNDRGTFEKDDDEWVIFNSFNSGLHGIPEDPTYEVIPEVVEDEEGNIWFANYGVGVVVYSPGEDLWETYVPSDGLVDRLTRSLTMAEQSVVWIGAEENGANRLTTNKTPFYKGDDTWDTLNVNDGFTNTTVNALLEDERGVVWLGTNEGLFQYEREILYRDGHVQDTGVLCIGCDAMDNVWVGTSDQGVFVFDRNGDFQNQFIRDNSGLVDNEVRNIAFNKETGEVWLATSVGLSRYESGIIRPRIEADEMLIFPNPFVLSQGTEPFVTFAPVPSEASVRIYTLSGELVTELGPNNNRWEGTNESGERVGSGIYVVVTTGPGIAPRMGKLAIIR